MDWLPLSQQHRRELDELHRHDGNHIDRLLFRLPDDLRIGKLPSKGRNSCSGMGALVRRVSHLGKADVDAAARSLPVYDAEGAGEIPGTTAGETETAGVYAGFVCDLTTK